MENHIILMAGLPGTGKTTIAKKLSEEFENYVLISQNNIRREQGIKRMPKTQEETLRKIDRMIGKYLSEGKGIIFDSINKFEFRRQQIYGIASCYGKNVVVLEIVCSEKISKQRMRKRPSGGGLLSDPYDPRVYDRIAKEWEPVINDYKHPGVDFVSYMIFNTEKQKLKKEIISKCMKKVIGNIEKILL